MSQTKTSTSKITKKDLEAQVADLQNSREILTSSNTALLETKDEYWDALVIEQDRVLEYARSVEFKDAQISDLQEALRQAQNGLSTAESLNNSLDTLLRAREAQQNFILRVLYAIAAYGGDNLQVVRNLAESVLSEANELS